ncbi:hypothetical protein HNY73_013969 [Argiope bruennichi]|uniref:Uncharacterized protein n=1 Tax=Argiope bruennichi TaxID=94029 RepID=A0A8T0EMC7_ARGBR|nr:hypothetical protein HNY73_013969 [Argiope bruennichi]
MNNNKFHTPHLHSSPPTTFTLHTCTLPHQPLSHSTPALFPTNHFHTPYLHSSPPATFTLHTYTLHRQPPFTLHTCTLHHQPLSHSIPALFTTTSHFHTPYLHSSPPTTFTLHTTLSPPLPPTLHHQPLSHSTPTLFFHYLHSYSQISLSTHYPCTLSNNKFPLLTHAPTNKFHSSLITHAPTPTRFILITQSTTTVNKFPSHYPCPPPTTNFTLLTHISQSLTNFTLSSHYPRISTNKFRSPYVTHPSIHTKYSTLLIIHASNTDTFPTLHASIHCH